MTRVVALGTADAFSSGARGNTAWLIEDGAPLCAIDFTKVTPLASIDCTAPCVMRSISVENFCPCVPKVERNTPVFSSSTRLRSLPR